MNFANEMVRRGHRVTILYLDGDEGAPYFPLDKQVKTENILYKNHKQIISERLPITYRIYREAARLFGLQGAKHVNAVYKGKMYGRRIQECVAAYKPDVVVACSPQSVAYVMNQGACPAPVALMCHDDCSLITPQLSKEELSAMSQCSFIQVLLPVFASVMEKYVPDVPIYAIGNIIEPAKEMACVGAEKERRVISCVASLGHRKNQKLLIDAFAKLADKFPTWDVEFFGGGTEQSYGTTLKKIIKGNHLENRVFLRGVTKEVGKVYAKSDIFCLPSRFEGFPLALCEAMAAGLPCVGLKTCTAVNYLIGVNEAGALAEDSPEDLARVLERLMQDAELRKQLGRNATEATVAYAPKVIWDTWEKLLQSVVK